MHHFSSVDLCKSAKTSKEKSAAAALFSDTFSAEAIGENPFFSDQKLFSSKQWRTSAPVKRKISRDDTCFSVR